MDLHKALSLAVPDANGIAHAVGYGETRRKLYRIDAHQLPSGRVCIPGRINTVFGPRVWTWARRVDWYPIDATTGAVISRRAAA